MVLDRAAQGGIMNKHAKQTAATTGLAALLMLFYGFYASPTGISHSELYNTAVDVFRWTLRVGGFAMLATSITCFLGSRVGLLFDFVVTGSCGIVMVLVGGVGLFAGGAPGMQDVLTLLFGGVFVRAAWTSWGLFNTATDDAVQAAPEPEPVHPASIHPDSLPQDDDPAPPNGYLAALSKEKEEPPSASYE